MSHRTLAVAALVAAPILPAAAIAAARPAEASVTVAAPGPHAVHRLSLLHRLHLTVAHRRHLAHVAHGTRRSLRDARARVRAVAASYVGTPYRYGGASRASVDCSGLVVAVMREAIHKRLPRTVAGLRAVARPVSTPLPGDLLFYTGEDHVAIVAAVSHGRVTSTWVARHSGTRVQTQRPYAAYTVGTVI